MTATKATSDVAANTPQALAAAELLRRRNAEDSLLHFTKYTFRAYKADPFHELVAGTLDRVVAGEIDRLMIFAPPQSGKSQLTSVHLPAYWLGRRPDDPVIITSYGSNLAEGKSREARNLVESPEYRRVFEDVTTAQDSRAVNDWSLAHPHRGRVIAAGVGGPVTGFGARCLAGETLVSTEFGAMPIAQLVAAGRRPRVWAFDHAANKVVLRRIIAVQESIRDDIVEVVTDRGRRIRSTSDHRFYVQGRGYQQAAFLLPGDCLSSFPVEQDLCGVRRNEEWARGNVPGVLSRVAQDRCGASVRLVQQDFRAAPLCPREGVEERCAGDLLRKGLSRCAQRCEERQAVRDMRQADAGSTKPAVLFKGMLAFGCSSGASSVQLVPDGVSAEKLPSAVLHQGVCCGRAFCQDARQGQWALQDRDELCAVVPGHEATDHRERRPSVRDLRPARDYQGVHAARATGRTNELTGSPYRWRQEQQQAGEPCDDVPVMPHFASRPRHEKVVVVRSLRTGGVPVYDIQVADCHNFFAGGVLVHNCGIIDDPHANWEQAQSLTMRNRVWDWWKGTFRTRIWEGGAVVLVMTRWHADDLAGRLLSDQANLWTVLRLPALAETQEERDEANRRAGLPLGQPDPLGRSPGEALAPTRFSRDALLSIKRDVGSLVWSAEYQGSPTTLEGTVFKRSWFRTVGAAPREARRVRYWDKAATPGGGAFSAGVLLAIDNDNRVFIEDVQRGQWSALERERIIKETALQDAIKYGDVRWKNGGEDYDIWDYGVDVWIEQEPGSSGKEAAESTIRNLIGFSIRAETPTGSKDVRLEPFRAQCEGGNVFLVVGPWNPAYLDELAEIPNGAYRDQSDASSGAFNKASKQTWLLA